MADIKQIKIGNTTYNIEPYTSYLPLSDLGYKTFKVTRGASQSTNTSGYWAAMINSSQAGSPSLPSTNTWWHVISMDWSGTDMSNWVSQLALPTKQGGVPHYRRNNADGTSIESSTWHAFITDEHIAVSSGDMPEGSGNLSATTSVHKMTFYRNGLSIPYQMDNANDGGILRCRGTSESNTILELGTWDDSGDGETIQFNYYPTTSQVTPTHSVTVPKKSGTIALTSDIEGHYLKWGGSAANIEAMGWGTLTSANEYTILSHASSSDGGDWGMTCKGGKIYMQLDGYYYQNEGQYRVLDTSDSSSFATAGHTHSNYVTTDTTQTISGVKTFTSPITTKTLHVSYIYNKPGTDISIEGNWTDEGEQTVLKVLAGRLQGYNYFEDEYSNSSYGSLQFEVPYGISINTYSNSNIYLSGNNSCYLRSTSNGWEVSGSDTYGCVYPAANHNGRIGLSDKHFYQGYINYIYTTSILPIAYNGSSATYNSGSVGSSSHYFGSGAFKTVYRTSESGLSDIRSKQNISNNDLNALNIINNLNIINFQYDDDIKAEARNKKQRLKAINTMKELPKTKETKELRKELQKIIATPNNEDMITIGVSAQQLQELLPKKYQKTFIQKESTNQYADQLFIRENRLVYLSFKAIQEQQAIIGSLEEKINLLEEKINALEEKMKKEVN